MLVVPQADIPIDDERDIAAGAAHVEVDRLSDTRQGCGVPSGDRPCTRSGQHRRHGSGKDAVETRKPAVRLHDSERSDDPGCAQVGGERIEVCGHECLDARIDHGGAAPLVLSGVGSDIGREADVEARRPVGEDLAHSSFIGRVEVREQERDGHGIDAGRPQLVGHGHNHVFIERYDHRSGRVDPLEHLEPPPPRDERWMWVVVELVELVVGASQPPDFQHIAAADSREQGNVCSLSLEQGVGGDRGRMTEECDIPRVEVGRCKKVG